MFRDDMQREHKTALDRKPPEQKCRLGTVASKIVRYLIWAQLFEASLA